jgi:hypothetical protein
MSRDNFLFTTLQSHFEVVDLRFLGTSVFLGFEGAAGTLF